MTAIRCPVHGNRYGRLLDLNDVLKDVPWEYRRPDYKTYLRSPEWRVIRHRKFVQQGNRCERCGDLGWEVHHLHYRTLGRENLSDLELLCTNCHLEEHDLL